MPSKPFETSSQGVVASKTAKTDEPFVAGWAQEFVAKHISSKPVATIDWTCFIKNILSNLETFAKQRIKNYTSLYNSLTKSNYQKLISIVFHKYFLF
jgi:hypothetical protein